MSFDILTEYPFRRDLLHDAGDIGPEMPGIGRSKPIPGCAEGLAGIAGSDEMNAAAPRSAVKGSQVIPDKRLTQGLVFHPRHESGRRMGFPLDESHSPVSRLCDVQAEVEPGIAGAERNASKVACFRHEAGR